MTATGSTASTLLVAIGMSKHRQEVLIGVPGKSRRRRGASRVFVPAPPRA